jgi:nuclear pore complex protein Nup188
MRDFCVAFDVKILYAFDACTDLLYFKMQDQAVAVVPELCGSNKSKYIDPEIQPVCPLLLPIVEMALYLEFCVLQICGISPVLGRVEEFSKEAK